MEILLSISIAILAGLMLSRVAKILKLPAVTAYLVAGILVGPYVLGQLGVGGLGFTSEDDIKALELFSKVALGFIAFSIGNEFRVSQLKKIGKQATIVGIFQAIFTCLTVDAFLIVLHFIIPDKFSLEAAIVLGAIATATAPAATLMVVKQYKAKGKLTDILLPVVALDDAVGLMVFAVSFGIAKSISLGSVNILSIVVAPILEVVFSLALGAAMGFAFNFCERFFHSRSKRLSVSVTFVLMTVAISMIPIKMGEIHVEFSPLLSCMMLGTIFCNICDFSEELMDRVDRWTAPLLVLFFVLSGAELKLSVFLDVIVVLVGVVYIISRSLGKYFGARFSAQISGCDPSIVKYLGITLLPQAGVALGMAMTAQTLGPEGEIVAQITLFAVLIYELIGPMLTKISLIRTGDIQLDGAVSAREEAKKRKLEHPHTVRHHRHHSS